MKGEMEIPAGKECGECPFLYDGNSAWDPTDLCCALFREENETLGDDDAKRYPVCLSAYPNGAVITITAREGK